MPGRVIGDAMKFQIALFFLALMGCGPCPKCPECVATWSDETETTTPVVEPEPEEEHCYLTSTEHCELFDKNGEFLSLKYRTTSGNICHPDLKYIRCFDVGIENARMYRLPIYTTGGVCPVLGDGPIECPSLDIGEALEPAD